MHIAGANVWLAVLVAILHLAPAGAAHGSSWQSHARRSLSGRKVTRREVDVQARDGLFESVLGKSQQRLGRRPHCAK